MLKSINKKILRQIKPQIVKFFNKNPKQVFSIKDIPSILRKVKSYWAMPASLKTQEFLNFLLENNILKPVDISTPYLNTTKYITKNANIYEVALSLNKNSYLSHYTALFLHNLTDNVPKVIYTNNEQSKKFIPKKKNNLLQANIDRAFSKPMRKTNHIARIKNHDILIYLLNGKNVNRAGVINLTLDGRKIPITSIERTLIDVTVRPDYAGGYEEVFNAFKMAKGNFSVNRLVATLKRMDYVYPYHQAIGFYMEKAGYDEKLLRLLKKIGINHKFYLTYNMKDTCFSDTWQLYYPKGF